MFVALFVWIMSLFVFPAYGRAGADHFRRLLLETLSSGWLGGLGMRCVCGVMCGVGEI